MDTTDTTGHADESGRRRGWVTGAALAAGGVVAGAILAGTMTASAAETSTTTPTPPAATSTAVPGYGTPPGGTTGSREDCPEDAASGTGGASSGTTAEGSAYTGNV